MHDQGGADVVEHAGCAVRGAREVVLIRRTRQHLLLVPRKLRLYSGRFRVLYITHSEEDQVPRF